MQFDTSRYDQVVLRPGALKRATGAFATTYQHPALKFEYRSREDFLDSYQIGSLPNWHVVSLSDEQISECRKVHGPIDMEEMRAALESASKSE